MEGDGPLVAVALGVALFVAIWLGVSLLTSLLSGWRALARAYRAMRPVPAGGWVERRALLSGRARYKNVLRLTATGDGLFLSVAWPFRLGHPPLFVPWSDLFSLPGASPALGYTELRFRRVASPRILVPDAAMQRLDEAAPGAWRAA
ncbi:MAG: hypothetical protein QNK03_18905 [Myxococcota bacterium]|nr:hypothetical protein [Myxococcota bacterium]